VSKSFVKVILKENFNSFKSELTIAEEKLAATTQKYSKDDLSKEIPPLNITRGTLKAVEMLNEGMYNKLFNNISQPNDDIIMPYQVFYQFINNKIAEIKDTKEFWEQSCKFLQSESNGKIGDYFNNSTKNFNFSDENIYKISRLIIGKEKKISPGYYSKLCGSTGLVLFLIKDALEYAGIIVEKKTLPARIYKNNKYITEKLKEKIASLENKLSNLK